MMNFPVSSGFAIKTCGMDGLIVGHLPMEISHSSAFLLLRSAVITGVLTYTHYRRSPIVEGGLEIACKLMITTWLQGTSGTF